MFIENRETQRETRAILQQTKPSQIFVSPPWNIIQIYKDIYIILFVNRNNQNGTPSPPIRPEHRDFFQAFSFAPCSTHECLRCHVARGSSRFARATFNLHMQFTQFPPPENGI